MNPVEIAVRRVASFGLEGGWHQSVDLGWDQWPSAISHLQRDAMTGMAAVLVDLGHIDLPTSDRNNLRRLDGGLAAHVLRCENELKAVCEHLADAGIGAIILKGSALAELSWTWGHARRWGDADVLVKSVDIDHAVEVLERQDVRRLAPEIRAGYDRRFAKSVTMRTDEGIEIDLHRTLMPGPLRFTVDEADLWARLQKFHLDGLEVSTLSPEATLVHLCLNAVVSKVVKLSSVRDVVEAAARCDLDEAIRLAERWRCRPALAQASSIARRRLGLTRNAGLERLEAVRWSPAERDLLSVYEGDRTERELALASVRHIDSVRDQLRFLHAHLRPHGSHRRYRGRSGLDQLRRVRRS